MNWKKIILTVLITTVVVVGIITIILYKFWQGFGEGFGEDCKKVETYYVKNYKIVKSECLGWAGPKYYPYDLYENGTHIAAGLLKKDSCQFYFAKGNDTMLILDLCKQIVQFLNPEKRNLNPAEIDSIVVTKMRGLNQKKLHQKEMLEFTTRWNNSIPDGATNPDQEYYPEPKYFIEVFTKNETRIFKTSHITIQEKGSFWEFNVLDKGEERTTQKFDKIFNMNE